MRLIEIEGKFTGSHGKCFTDSCVEVTQHGSGLCVKCRTYTCALCLAVFQSKKNLGTQKKLCGDCARKKKGRAKLEEPHF